jgi:hypothetical protein
MERVVPNYTVPAAMEMAQSVRRCRLLGDNRMSTPAGLFTYRVQGAPCWPWFTATWMSEVMCWAMKAGGALAYVLVLERVR